MVRKNEDGCEPGGGGGGGGGNCVFEIGTHCQTTTPTFQRCPLFNRSHTPHNKTFSIQNEIQ